MFDFQPHSKAALLPMLENHASSLIHDNDCPVHTAIQELVQFGQDYCTDGTVTQEEATAIVAKVQ